MKQHTEPDRAAKELVVTSAMMRAGQDVLWRYDRDGDDSAATVRELFLAMLQAQHESGHSNR